ncbi:MAG: FHA domain-containing protein [Pseudomonadota bacterium]
MDAMTGAAGKKAGTSHADPFVEGAAQRRLIAELERLYDGDRAIAVITGDSGSGRQRLIDDFLRRRGPRASYAVLDGDSAPLAFLNSAIGQFGYDFSSKVAREMIGMLRLFAVHQTDAGFRPVMVIRNAERMKAGLRAIIGELADLVAREQPALLLILSGNATVTELLAGPDLAYLESRIAPALRAPALNADELPGYVSGRCGVEIAGTPLANALLNATGGLPGSVDGVMRRAAAAANGGGVTAAALSHVLASNDADFGTDTTAELPQTEAAHFLVSQSGQLLGQEELGAEHILIGRAEHNDILLDSPYVSRHHALVVRGDDDCDWLIDLNSRNGTFVNSRAINRCALRHNDIVSMGNHRLKYVNAAATGMRPSAESFEATATRMMRSIPKKATKAKPAEGTLIKPVQAR